MVASDNLEENIVLIIPLNKWKASSTSNTSKAITRSSNYRLLQQGRKTAVQL